MTLLPVLVECAHVPAPLSLAQREAWMGELTVEMSCGTFKIRLIFYRIVQKRYMGFKSFMVRSVMAFDRLLIILSLAHFFFTCGLGRILAFHVSAIPPGAAGQNDFLDPPLWHTRQKVQVLCK